MKASVATFWQSGPRCAESRSMSWSVAPPDVLLAARMILDGQQDRALREPGYVGSAVRHPPRRVHLRTQGQRIA